MPFLPKQLLSNVGHRSWRLAKIFLGWKKDHFVKLYEKQAAKPNIELNTDKGGTCPLCGFALAYIESDGWLMETCSATGLKLFEDSPALWQWFSSLKQNEKKQTGLQLNRQDSISITPIDRSPV